jgi:hypothetical protein
MGADQEKRGFTAKGAKERKGDQDKGKFETANSQPRAADTAGTWIFPEWPDLHP